MANFVLLYAGGSIPEGDQAMREAMARWEEWFARLGESVVDWGSPFGAAATVSADGAVGDGASAGVTGYSIIAAPSLSAATEAAQGCPVLAAGGSVQVYESTPIG
jgi:hypothetical protein